MSPLAFAAVVESPATPVAAPIGGPPEGVVRTTGTDPDRGLRHLTLRDSPRPSDAVAVERLVRETGFFTGEETTVAAQIVDQRIREGPASDYRFVFVDDARGNLVGYVCFGRISFTQTSYDVYWIVVDPTAQRGGLGRLLLREAEAAITALGGTQVFIETAGRDLYAPTRRFYERSGYRVAARLDDFYAPGDAKVVYVKRMG
ncbi:MAG: GNAT family N-acetyltransferase [Phycisphaerales bacterium]